MTSVVRPFVGMPRAPQAYDQRDQTELRRAIVAALDSIAVAGGNQTTTLTGDVTGAGVTSIATTLATVNATVGSFGSSTAIPSFTVNAKGLITAASTNAVIAPAGTLTGTTLAATVVTSSLTTIGTLVAGAVPASLVTAGTFGAGNFITNGNFAVGTNSGAVQRELVVNGAAGHVRALLIQTAGVNRFGFLIDGAAESGSDAGSGIQFNAYTDAGVVSGLFSVLRAAGSAVLWTRPMRVTSTAAEQFRVAYDATNFLGVQISATGFVTFSTNDTPNDLFQFSSSVAVDGATPTTTAGLQLLASASGKASLRVPHGTAPSSPVNGDVWTDTTSQKVRINGTTHFASWAEQSTISDPTGGGVQDAEARTAINAIIDALQATNIIA